MTTNKLALILALSTTACTQGPLGESRSGSNRGSDDSGWDDSGWGDDDSGSNDVGSSDCGGDFDGSLWDEADASHTFQVDQDRDVAITLEWMGSSDLDLHLLDSSGSELHRSETDGGGTGEELELWLQAGSYRAKVVQWDDVSADYELEVDCE